VAPCPVRFCDVRLLRVLEQLQPMLMPCYHLRMTTIEVLFRYTLHPSESAMSALGNLREVYGIRRIAVKEQEQTIRVEYDATRLSAPVIEKLLRSSGIAISEQISLLSPPPPPVYETASVAASSK
jgi:hypothetical protein